MISCDVYFRNFIKKPCVHDYIDAIIEKKNNEINNIDDDDVGSYNWCYYLLRVIGQRYAVECYQLNVGSSMTRMYQSTLAICRNQTLSVLIDLQHFTCFVIVV